MSEVKPDLLYSKEHEWVDRIDPQTVRIGITDFAQCQLGDIVFVELPEAGAAVKAGEIIGTIESVKTVSDLYSPVSGTVTKVNGVLSDQPEQVNNEPYDGGWMLEINIGGNDDGGMSKLLTGEQYLSMIDGQDE